MRARSPAIRHEPRVDAKPVASALRRVGSKADLATGTNAGGGGGGGGGGDSASEPSTSRGNSVRGATSAADLVQGARQTSFGSLPVYKPGVQVERMPRLDRIDSTTSAETTDTSPRSTSEEGSRRTSRDGGAVRKRGGRSRSSSSSAMQHSDDVVTDDAYQYKSRGARCSSGCSTSLAWRGAPARMAAVERRQVLSRIVEDVETLDADATDDDMRHHLDGYARHQPRVQQRSGARGLLPRAHVFEHCSARAGENAPRRSAVPHGIDASQGLHDVAGKLAVVRVRPSAVQPPQLGPRSGSGRSNNASSESEKSVAPIGGPKSPWTERSSPRRSSPRDREREGRREAPSSGAEVPFRIPTRTRIRSPHSGRRSRAAVRHGHRRRRRGRGTAGTLRY